VIRDYNLLQVLQFAGLALMMAALPLSNFLMSISIIWLSAVWVLWVIYDRRSAGVFARWYNFRYNPAALRFSAIYLVFLVSLAWSSDMQYALKDLRTKLPVLVLPLVISGLSPVSARQERMLIRVFLVTLVLAVSVCFLVYTGHYNRLVSPLGLRTRDVQNIRDISIFISHIRFSLLIVMGLVFLYYSLRSSPSNRLLSILTAVYFLIFLWTIESVTAFVILGVLLLTLWISKVFSATSQRWRLLSLFFVLFAISSGIWWAHSCYKAYFTYEDVDFSSLDKFSPYGEAYAHDTSNKQIENGHYTMIYIAWGELAAGWSERSSMEFEGKDKIGNPLKGTLIRYLTAKGLRKDGDGVRSLNDKDIQKIEQGIPNERAELRSGLRKRLDKIFFEYDTYLNGGNPSGHSVFQRFEFWKTGLEIIRGNVFFGVGVGDVRQAFRDHYVAMNSPLDESHRLRAHNQFLTLWISLGLTGFITIVILLAGLFRRSGRSGNPLFIAFFMTAMLSFLTEDTLESQAGVTFFSFFACFLLFLPRRS
jgi:hypothetical protein